MATLPATTGHTAGIFADMSLDGPEIGTLVAVIDRARNLPNRKTMGKQDPYCAMRLGKEAKKTETDRRGGQTPKWDQELRFTVHGSPDYYRLKCSVFNDDKKTDLIGESWVDLKEVVVPGGGQNDLWHQLQFKGKYAGEIRMELTYYDTRPKDEMLLDKKRERTRHNSQSTAASEAGGSRQLGPREIKRRPLPPSPAGTPPSQNPLREPPPPPQQSPHVYEQAIMTRKQFPTAQPDSYRSQYPNPQLQERQHSYPDASTYATPEKQPLECNYDDLELYQEEPFTHDYPHSSPTGHPALDPPPSQLQYAPQPLQPTWEDEQRTLPSNSSPSSQRWSSPGSIPPHVQPSDPRQSPAFNRYSTSPIKNVAFRDSPLRQSVSHHEVASGPEYGAEAGEAPPPPPAHRQGSATASPVAYATPNAGRSTIPVSPLDARSPLQAIERRCDPYRSSPIAQVPQEVAHPSLPQQPSHVSNDRFRHNTDSFAPNNSRSVAAPPRSGSYDAMLTYEDPQPFQEDARRYSNGPQHTSGPYNRNIQRLPPGSSTYDAHHVYTSSPPLFKPRAVSPNAPHHEIPRRSVSPNQGVVGRESLRGVPFGPDAYESINPVRSSPATSQPQSPAEALEEARQKEVDRLRESGPIIGNDGREIDPTDHLPSDTWAPEPERKNRKPEVVIRLKTKDETRRPPVSSPGSARPQSYAGYASSPASVNAESPSARNGRDRLQKQAPSRPLPVQPYQHANSSPAVPQQITPTRPMPSQAFQHANSSPSVPMAQRHQIYSTPPRMHPMRPALSEYSINGGDMQSNSPQHSPYDNITLPPVPAKIPLPAQEQHRDYARPASYDSLCAELSSIDIGPSRGSRTGLRSSRGYGY